MAAVNFAAAELDFDAPRIKPIRLNNKRIRYLTIPHAEALTQAYAQHVQPIVLTYRYTGCRTQEALQLQAPNVDMRRQTMFFDNTKNGEPRTVKMHDRVAEAVDRLLHSRDYPQFGHVFLNRLGEPDADTRLYRLPGGNPLRSAHRTAVRRAQIQPVGGDDFTVHDWRHHWACQCVMNGIDLETIKKLGGWKSLRMVERYTAVSDDHMDAAIDRLAEA